MTTRRGRNPEKIPALKSPVVKLDRDQVFALISSLVSADLEHSRRNRFDGGEMANWIVATPLGEGGLEMDSIELLQVSSAVDEFFICTKPGSRNTCCAIARSGSGAISCSKHFPAAIVTSRFAPRAVKVLLNPTPIAYRLCCRKYPLGHEFSAADGASSRRSCRIIFMGFCFLFCCRIR